MVDPAWQGAWAAQNRSVGNWQQRRQNLKSLTSALQADDLNGAQQAFATIASNNPNIDSSSPLGRIGNALQTGDISGAHAWLGHRVSP